MTSPLSGLPTELSQLRSVRYERNGWVASVVIDRAASSNALDTRSLVEIALCFDRVATDDEVAVAVLTGAGERAFCSGGDVAEYSEYYLDRPEEYWKYLRRFRAAIESITGCGKVVVARLNGFAVGGGNELQLACDLAVMGEHAFISQVGTRVGSVAAMGSTQWLPLAAGDRRAREILFLNERVPAGDALRWGLVNRVVPTVRKAASWVVQASPEEVEAAQRRRDAFVIDLSRLDEEVAVLTDRLVQQFPQATRYTKTQLNALRDLVWNQTVGHSADWLTLHKMSVEPHEGMGAFLHKRKVDYQLIRRQRAGGGSLSAVGGVEGHWGAETVSCGSCGTGELPSRFRFCGVCGAFIGTENT